MMNKRFGEIFLSGKNVEIVNVMFFLIVVTKAGLPCDLKTLQIYNIISTIQIIIVFLLKFYQYRAKITSDLHLLSPITILLLCFYSQIPYNDSLLFIGYFGTFLHFVYQTRPLLYGLFRWFFQVLTSHTTCFI